jgi:hypothetical protein
MAEAELFKITVLFNPNAIKKQISNAQQATECKMHAVEREQLT